jgi:HSP20 family protein
MAMRRDVRRPWPDIFDWAEGLPGMLSWPGRETGNRSFRIEEFDEDGQYLIRAEIPGVDPATDISVQVEQGVLTISAERQERRREGGHSEFVYGKFSRSVGLPPGADESRLKARYDNGILEVSVPVGQAPPQARTIPVQTGPAQPDS